MLGTYVLSAGYYDAYYLRAQKIRTLIRRDFEAAFQKGIGFAIVSPTSPSVAFQARRTHQRSAHPYLADAYTVSANLANPSGT